MVFCAGQCGRRSVAFVRLFYLTISLPVEPAISRCLNTSRPEERSSVSFPKCAVISPAAQLIDPTDVEVIALLYMATEQAMDHLHKGSQATWGAKGIPYRVEAVQRLPNDIKLEPSSTSLIVPLIQHQDYYDPAIMDPHLLKGKTSDVRFGYAACGLPLVLHHNTPNNSVALLFSYENLGFRGLFPRIQRHREMS